MISIRDNILRLGPAIGLILFCVCAQAEAQEQSIDEKHQGNFQLEEGEALPRSKVSQAYHQQISEILAHEDFGKEIVEQAWRFKTKKQEPDDESDELSWLSNFFDLSVETIEVIALLIELLLWAIGIALAVWLGLKMRSELPRWLGKLPARETRSLPSNLFGVELKETPLPEDISLAARALWDQGEPRQALSLLLRGGLISVLESYPCHLFDGDTETECLQKIQAASPTNIGDYMADLIQVWQLLAYAHQPPQERHFEQLCRAYREVFV